MAGKTIQVVVSEEEKDKIELLFSSLGMTTAGAIKIFLKQSLMENALPFQPKKVSRRLSEEQKEELFKLHASRGAKPVKLGFKDGRIDNLGNSDTNLEDWLKNG